MSNVTHICQTFTSREEVVRSGVVWGIHTIGVSVLSKNLIKLSLVVLTISTVTGKHLKSTSEVILRGHSESVLSSLP